MQVTAYLSRLRMSPQKVRLVANLVQGLGVVEADAQLQHFARAAALPVRKLIASAVANAVHNFSLDRSNLIVRQVRVDQGPTLKRFNSRAFGRATTIRKRTSHVTVLLDERVPTVEIRGRKSEVGTAPLAPTVVADRATATRAMADDDAGATKGAAKPWQQEGGKGGKRQRRGFFNRMFNRRSGER